MDWIKAGPKDVAIPGAEIERTQADGAYMRPDTRSIEALPAISVRRVKVEM
jgi:hypothetical protein